MFAEALKRAGLGQQPQQQFSMQGMMPQMQGMQAPQMDMFGQSNNAGMLMQALRGLQWPRLI